VSAKRKINQASFYILLSLLLCVSCSRSTEKHIVVLATPTSEVSTATATVAPTAISTTTATQTAIPTPKATASRAGTASQTGTAATNSAPSAEIRSAGRLPNRQRAPVSPLETPEVHAKVDDIPPAKAAQSRRLTLDNDSDSVSVTPALTTTVMLTKTVTALPLNLTTNVLLLGSDRRADVEGWRTDVIMIIALDMESRSAGVISIPRDLYLDEIPLADIKANRINVVDYLGEQDQAGGGPRALAHIIEDHIGVPIHHYLRFEFGSFQRAIDTLGGIEVEVDCAGSYYVEEEDEERILELPPGLHRLSGSEALAYVRSRDVLNGDLDRARRQQRLAWAVRNQVLRENLLPRIPALYAILAPSIQTDIGIAETIKFTSFALELKPSSIHGLVLTPPDLLQETVRDEMFVFLPQWDAIAQAVQTIFERPPFEQTNTIGPNGDNMTCP